MIASSPGTALRSRAGRALGQQQRRVPHVRRAAAPERSGPSGLAVDGHSPTSPRGWDAMRSALLEAGCAVLSPQEVIFALERGALLVDVRPEDDYDKGHVPGAVNVPFYRPITGWSPFKIARRLGYAAFGVLAGTEVNPDFAAQVAALHGAAERGGDAARRIVLYCSQGGVLESTEAYRRGWQTRCLVAAYDLCREGLGADLAILRGGYTEWVAGGRDIEVMELVDDDGAGADRRPRRQTMGGCFSSSPEAPAGPAAAAPAPAPAPAAAGAMKPFVGANCYYLLTRAADPGCRPLVLDTLDAAAKLGFTVLRIWAFNDGPGWMSLQPAPGQLEEQVLAGLDWLLVEGSKRGLRFQLTLTNYWAEFGGMPQYVKWAQGLPEDAKPGGDAFFSDAAAQALYANFVAALVGRTNTLTGVPYRDDPAIHSWDLANECRCEGDAGAGRVAAWVHAAAAHVKSLDATHPVTVGLEGFFGPSSPGLLPANPYNVTHGVDFVREFSSPHIDFASIHMYADQWCPGSDDDTCRWSVEWVRAHMRACAEALGGKPLVLQEFGKKPAGAGRTALFQQMSALLTESVAGGGVLVAAMVWMFAAEAYPDYDGYTVYASGAPDAQAAGQGAQPVVQDAASAAALAAMAAAVAGTPAPS
ncbi:MAN1 [Scenedesmus sp. PABB004]|nr:MAN1 [Scenedesmus sp. PABB004]